MEMCWVWSRAIITFVSSQETRHSFPFSRRVMPWSSLRSVVRHCFTLAFIRQYDIVLKFNVACTGDSCAPVCDPPPVGGGVVVASRSATLLVLSSWDCELTVAPVRFAPDCAPVLLFDCLGHPTFCFAIWYCRCKMPLIKLLCDELFISPLLQ